MDGAYSNKGQEGFIFQIIEREKKIVITISQKSWLIGIEFPFTTSCRLASMRIDNPFFWDK